MHRRLKRGFTLIELMVVITIIGVLAGIIMPALSRVREDARRTTCKNNLRNIHKAYTMYMDDHIIRGRPNPPKFLSSLSEHYLSSKYEVFLCPNDSTEGSDGGKPYMDDVDQYDELNPRAGIYFPGSNDTRLERWSYMYEMAMGVECSWGLKELWLPSVNTQAEFDAIVDLDGDTTKSMWGEVKMAQLKYGDSYSQGGYPETRFPILRCFWHASHPNTSEPEVINLSLTGEIFMSGSLWEDTALFNP